MSQSWKRLYIKAKKEATKGRKRGIRGSEMWRERERGHSGTRQRKPSQRDKTGWQGKREREGGGKRGDDREGGSRRSSWHTADVSSITVSPPSGGRSEERPPPSSLPAPLSFSVLGSPELLCNEAGRGMKAGERRVARDPRFIIYLLVLLKDYTGVFFFCMF